MTKDEDLIWTLGAVGAGAIGGYFLGKYAGATIGILGGGLLGYMIVKG